MTPDELVSDALAQRELTGFTEIHMVNGENPHVGFDFYVETIGKLHGAMPDVHLKCYTASEIHHMTTLSGLSHEAVLRELARVPYGQLETYGALAAKVGRPRAARAVGTAMNRNPIPIVLPCHRVVGADGSLTGYAGGLHVKRALLELEGATLPL